ncbi:MAG: EscC/YscC/HrcC family type III secretion system outer membrane ring protein, partial [Desulfovibrio sp.]|nr:EscC/YscC/HrcC family type III secretion system outer membrane ring protein [Desulfovibrio sp.]
MLMPRFIWLVGVVLLSLSLSATAWAKPKARHQAPPPQLFQVPFTHVAANEPLPVLLAEFARIEGYNCLVSPALKGEVNGNFEQINPHQFLDSMGAAYQVRWFCQGRTINFYAQGELQQAFLTPSVVKATSLLELFREAGILSQQLTHKLIRNKNVIFVQAPGFYIEQLRQAMNSMEQAQSNRITMRVFHLKNAWAEDKQVNSSNDTTITVPGVASILRAMVSGNQQGQTTVSTSPAVQQGLLGSGLAAGKKNQDQPAGASGAQAAAPTQAASSQSKSQQPSQVNIMADPRVNAVVITDAEYRMEYYARVIESLDKPVRLVEIHAAIVDIDSNYQRELGINYQFGAALGKHWTAGGAGAAAASQGTMPSVGEASSSGLSFSTLYTRGTDFFLTRVRALEEDGVARMLGRPTVLTTDNVQATLENTSTYYIP